ncbi:MAG: hypothetical protein H6741_05660 [Alphaproteobacteria bacterium]|nr:hypothetical protein [Alphaproteobacteria bacterium]
MGALLAVFPKLRDPNGQHLFADWHDPYVMGDLAGTLFSVRRASLGELGTETALLGAPVGEDLILDFPNTLITNLIGALVQPLGFTLGYNLAVLGILASNGLCAYAALRLLGGGRWAALASGLTLAALPLMADELLRGRPVTAWWGPALLGMALCAASLGSWRRLALVLPGAALVAFSIRVYPFAPLLLLPWTLAAGLHTLWPLRREHLARGAAALALASAIVLPGALALLGLEESRAVDPSQGILAGLPQGVDVLTPRSLFNLSWGAPSRLGLPASLSLAAALASLLAWRRWALWAPAALCAAGLLAVSLGPDAGLPVSPYSLLMEQLPFMQAAPRPTRYALGGAVCLCLWLGLALSEATRRWPRALVAPLSLGLAALILAQAQPLTPRRPLLWPQQAPLKAIEGEPLVLDLPLVFLEPQSQLAQLAAQPVPRMNPSASRLLDWENWQRDLDYPLLHAALAVQRGQTPDPRWLAALQQGAPEQALGLRYVVLHKKAAGHGELRRWTELIAALPLVEVEVVGSRVVYALETGGGGPR